MSAKKTSNSAGGDEIDLSQLFYALWNSKWIVLASFLVFLGGSVIYAVNLPATYQADSLLQLEAKAGSNTLIGGLEELSGSNPRSTTEIELMKSRLVLGKAVADVNGDWRAAPREFEFLGHLISKHGHRFRLPESMTPYAQGGEKIEVEFLRVSPELVGKELVVTKTSPTSYELRLPSGETFEGKVGTQLSADAAGVALNLSVLNGAEGREFTVRQISEKRAIAQFRARLSIAEKGRGSGVMNATFRDGDPRRAVRHLDAIVLAYLTQNISRNAAEAESSLAFIESSIPNAREVVDEAEAKLRTLQSRRETVDLDFETQALLQLRSQIESELAAISVEEEDIQSKYTPNHPTYKALLVRKSQLEGRLADLQEKSLSLPETQRQVFDATQELELARETYSRLLIRAQELRVVKASTIGNVRVIDRAQYRNAPVEPKKNRIIGLAGLIGIFVGLALALIRQSLRQGITSSKVIEEMGWPVFAVIGKSQTEITNRKRKSKRGRILSIADPTDLAVEAFRGLRTSLHFGLLEKNKKVLSITSASPNCGKTFCSLNIATVSAQAEQKICLVDADMRRGDLRKYFDVEKNAPGLADVLAGKAALDDALTDTHVEGLSFMSTGAYPPNPSELLMLPSFEKLVDDLDERFDLVIIDCPPALAVTDPIMIARRVGMTLVVVRYRVTTPREIEAIEREFDAVDAQISGAILNAQERGKDSRGTYDYRYEYR